MARRASPWYDNEKKCWKIKVDGKAVRLVDGPKDETTRKIAEQQWHILASRQASVPEHDQTPVATVLLAYLQHKKVRKAATRTITGYQRAYASFAESFPELLVADLRPGHIWDWFDHNPQWKSDSTKAAHLAALLAALYWAASPDIGRISRNPLARMRDKPQSQSRAVQVVISKAEYDRLLATLSTGDRLCIVLRMLWETGCRPSELCSAKAKDFSGQIWTVVDHKTAKKTGRKSSYVISLELEEEIQRLAQVNPEGPVLRTTYGKPWRPDYICKRLRDLCSDAGLRSLIPYGFRHAFAADALEAGESDALVAALLNHKDTKMVHMHYGHLNENSRAKLAAANRIHAKRGSPSEPAALSSPTSQDTGGSGT